MSVGREKDGVGRIQVQLQRYKGQQVDVTCAADEVFDRTLCVCCAEHQCHTNYEKHEARAGIILRSLVCANAAYAAQAR